MTTKANPKKKQKEQISLIQQALKAAPNDSAANHYWIHAVEASPHPEQALKSAAMLASLAPASGHMVHMPGHITTARATTPRPSTGSPHPQSSKSATSEQHVSVAHSAYAAALKERPNSGFSLYGMAQASEAAANTATAREEYAKFLTAWKNSDGNRPELAHAREYIGSQKAVVAADMHP
jgi:hypothetical protein